jgi:WD40 repeat protein
MSSVILTAGTNGNLFQFAAKTGKKLFHTEEVDNFILCMDYAPDGKAFATAGKDNTIRIYDEETKKVAE